MLVLERRERLGGACTLERPFPDQRYSVSPCAYVVGLLDELVIDELQLSQRGFECYVADPNLWVPFEDGTSFGQWLDDDKTQAQPRAARGLQARTSTATGPTSTSSTRSASGCAPAAATPGSARRPTREEIEDLLHGEQTMIDIVFNASIADVLDDYMTDQRLKDALFGQGVIAAYGGPKDPGTASIKLMHYQGDLEGQGPVWGYVKGGMGMISFAIADAAQEAGAHARGGRPGGRDPPGEGVRARGRHAHPRPHGPLQRRPEGRAGPARPTSPPTTAQRLEAWKVRSPVVKFNAALTALPEWTAAPGEDWPAQATIDLTGGLEDAQRAFEACDRGEPAVGFGEIYIQTGYDPTPGARGPPPAQRLRPVRALRARARDLGHAAARRSRASSST